MGRPRGNGGTNVGTTHWRHSNRGMRKRSSTTSTNEDFLLHACWLDRIQSNMWIYFISRSRSHYFWERSLQRIFMRYLIRVGVGLLFAGKIASSHPKSDARLSSGRSWFPFLHARKKFRISRSTSRTRRTALLPSRTWVADRNMVARNAALLVTEPHQSVRPTGFQYGQQQKQMRLKF